VIWTLAGAVKAAAIAIKLTFEHLSFEKIPAETAEEWVRQRTSVSELY